MLDVLLRYRRFWLVQAVLRAVFGIQLPGGVRIGDGLRLPHGGYGTVVHPSTVIGDNVTLYHQITIGRQDIVSDRWTNFGRVEIGDGATICAGAKVLGGSGVLRVGEGTVVAANAVLLCATGQREVWAGVPARKVGER